MSEKIIEGAVKYRDGKKWKARWAVVKKASPVADCVTLNLYKDSGDSHKPRKEKLAISLKRFLGLESGFQYEKESHVLAVLCGKQVELLAFSRRDVLIDWQVRLREQLGQERSFPGTLIYSPASAKLNQGPVKLLVHSRTLCLVAHVPPRILVSWLLSDLRRFGTIGRDKFGLEGGQKCGKGCGHFVFLTDFGDEINYYLTRQSDNQCRSLLRVSSLRGAAVSSQPLSSPSSPTKTCADFGWTARQNQTNIRDSVFPERWWFDGDHPSDANDSLHFNQSGLTLNGSDHAYENQSPVSPSNSASINTSTRRKKHKLSFLHRHSKSTDHENRVPKYCAASPPVSPSATKNSSLPIAHGYSKSADSADRESDFMDLSDYLWHTRKEGSASARNIAWEESVLKKTHQSLIGTGPGYVNTDPQNRHKYENQQVIDAQLKLKQLSVHSSISNISVCDKEHQLGFSSDSAISPEGAKSPSSSLGDYPQPVRLGSDLDLLDEILQAVSESQRAKGLNASLVIDSSQGQIGGESETNCQTEPAIRSASDKSPISEVCRSAIGSNQAVNQTASQIEKDNCKQKIDSNHDSSSLAAAENALNSSHTCTDSCSAESLLDSLCLHQYFSKSVCSAAEATDLCTCQVTQLQPRDSHIASSQLGTHRCTRLIYTQSLPNLNIISSDLDDLNASAMSSKPKTPLAQGVSKMSLQDSPRPLQFVDLSRFDGLDEGYLYWLKAQPDGTSQGPHPGSSQGGHLVTPGHGGYDNVRAHDGPEYENVRQVLKPPASGYDNVGYTSPQNTRCYDNAPEDNRTDSVKLCADNDATQTLSQHQSKSEKYCSASARHIATTSDTKHKQTSTKPPSTIPKSRCSSKHTSSGWTGLSIHASLRRYKNQAQGSVCRNALSKGAGSYVTLRRNGECRANAPAAVTGSSLCNLPASSASSSLCTIPVARPSSNTCPADQHTSTALLFIDYNDPHRDNLVNSITEQQRMSAHKQSKHSPRGHGKQAGIQLANLMTTDDAAFNSRRSAFTTLDNWNRTSSAKKLDQSGCDFVMVKASSYNKSRKHTLQDTCDVKLPVKADSLSNSKVLDPSQAPGISDSRADDRASSDSRVQNRLNTRVPLPTVASVTCSAASKNETQKLSSVPPPPRTFQRVHRECEYIDMYSPCNGSGPAGLNGNANDDVTYDIAPALPPKLPPKPSSSQSLSNSNLNGNRSLSNTSMASSHSAASTDSSTTGSNIVVGDSPKTTRSTEKAEQRSAANTREFHRVNSAPATGGCRLSSPYMDMTFALGSKTFPKAQTKCEGSQPKLFTQSKSMDNELEGADGYYDMGAVAAKGQGSETSGQGKQAHAQPSESSVDSGDAYLPMSSLSRQVSSSSSCDTSGQRADDSSTTGEARVERPFDVLVEYERAGKKDGGLCNERRSIDRGQSGCTEIEKPFDLLDIDRYEKESRKSSVSPSKTDVKNVGQEDNLQSHTNGRRGSKSQGLFARLMRRNSSAKELSKISKSQEDILEDDLSSQIPASISPTKSKKEPIYAQIPELKGELPPEPHTMPLKKKEFLRQSSSESLLDPQVKSERGRFLTIAAANRSWLEHGNLTDEQKQSCASLLSDRSMTPPTPPPDLPLPPPPLPPRPGRTSLGAAPPLPPKTYNNTSMFSSGRKPEPEYADIDENGFFRHSLLNDSSQRMRDCKGYAVNENSSIHIVEYVQQTHEQTTASFFRFDQIDTVQSQRHNDSNDSISNPPPRPPRRPSNQYPSDSHVLCNDESEETNLDEQEGEIWVERVFPRVKSKPGGRLRSLSLRGSRNSVSSDTASLTSQLSYTEPSSPFRTIDAHCFAGSDARIVSSPASTVLRPRAGKEYLVVDRRRLLGDEGLSSGPSSGSRTPVSPLCQSSPTKSPAGNGCVFNFDPAVVRAHDTSSLMSSGGADDSPTSPAGMAKSSALRDPDPVYMNLSFPPSSRGPSPLVIDPRRCSHHVPDYANVVLNYAEIDLSKSGRKGGKVERPLASSNAVTEYSVIDMVATIAASQAAKDHSQSREIQSREIQSRDEGGMLKQLRRRGDAESKENSKRKERKSVPSASSARSFLSRSNSSASRSNSSASRSNSSVSRSNSSANRSSSASRDRKSSLPVISQH